MSEPRPESAEPGWMRGLRAFHNHNYRLYFAGQFVSMIGTWMQRIAQGWLVLQLTHSPFALGVVTALQSLPMLIFALIGGVIADRVSKYRLLTATQAVSAILALILALDVTAGTVQIWHLYLLATLLGTVNAMNLPTQQAFTVEMVGKEDLLNAIALNSALVNSARIIGPSVAGVLIAVVGLALCFYLNALSFLAVIVGLLLMRPAEFRVKGAVQRQGSARAQLAEGLGYIRRTPSVWRILVLVAAVGTFAWNWNVILPLFADRVLHIGATGFGVMTSAMGVGSLLAAVTLAFGRRARWSVMAGGVASVVFFSLLFAWSRLFPISLLLLVLMGASNMSFNTQANTTVQSLVPDALRGRVMSVYMMLFIGSQPLGSFLTGTLAAHFGAPVALVVDVLACAAVLAIVVAHGRPAAAPELEPEVVSVTL